MNYVGAFMLTVSQERGAGAGTGLVLRALRAPAAGTSSTAAKLSYKRRQRFSSAPFCVSGCCSRQHTAVQSPAPSLALQVCPSPGARCPALPAVPPAWGCLSKLQGTSSQQVHAL